MDDELFTAMLKEIRLLRNEITELKAIVAPTKVLPAIPFYKDSDDMDGKISSLLLELRVPAHIKGHAYLREAINQVYADDDMYGCFTTILYPEIAEKFNTAPNRVERAIRHAIEVSWRKNKEHPLYVSNFNKTKPTNSEFIALIADKLKLEEKSKIKLEVV